MNLHDLETAIIECLEQLHGEHERLAPSKRMTFQDWLKMNIEYDQGGQPHIVPVGSMADGTFQALVDLWAYERWGDEPLDVGELLRLHGRPITLTKDYGPVLEMSEQAA